MNSVRTQRRKEHARIAIAVALSLLIHLLIVLAALVYLALFKPGAARQAKPRVEPQPVKVTFIPPPPTPVPTPPMQREFADSAEGLVTEKKPENAMFESDQNTEASSQLPAQSSLPVPTLYGDNGPGMNLREQRLTLGQAKQPAPNSPAVRPQPAAPQPRKQPEEQKQPEQKQPEDDKPPQDAKATPTPKPMPRPEDAELALLDPTRPRSKPKPEEEAEKPEQPTRPVTPSNPAFQPERHVTRLTGGISSNGKRASLAAERTPLGRYQKMLSDAIGSRWYFYVDQKLDYVNVGTVQLRFVVEKDGRVKSVKVLGNSSNQMLAGLSMAAVSDAEIPPMPKDVSDALAGNRLEIDYSFTIVGR